MAKKNNDVVSLKINYTNKKVYLDANNGTPNEYVDALGNALAIVCEESGLDLFETAYGITKSILLEQNRRPSKVFGKKSIEEAVEEQIG